MNLFGWGKKDKRVTFQQDPVGFLLQDADDQIEICRQAIGPNREGRQFALMARNVRTVLGCVLERVALQARAPDGRGTVRAELERCRPYIALLIAAVELRASDRSATDPFVLASTFTPAILAAMLLGDWPLADQVSKASCSAAVREEGGEADSGGVHDEEARMAAAAVTDDGIALGRLRARFARDRVSDPYFLRHFHHDVAMDLIVHRDEAGFAKEMAAHESRFLARAADPSTKQRPLLDACFDENRLVIDVWAVALCLLARHRGMVVDVNTECLPLDLFGAG
ncbi:hypothetical protein [Piscinibacter gummiphilus]|uniref:Uncharacterized protein n=1 Tax=Piscinibacter gummiphilus TaxID=946333 RepID=A0A1W6L601_9BURK|nr:hypothetical protein [Piscinibacter gummiphilus]ARN19684.1 hypothetical protein A4W93_07020 [Piscinibacter gummiphilus]ATU64351.1 hypothetical protein CPZ87_07100 [Piscinibacter gummiphilus]GLS95255.1 hypothetical protein GCM10007918_25470 [Piscinibacter gummiphilus]